MQLSRSEGWVSWEVSFQSVQRRSYYITEPRAPRLVGLGNSLFCSLRVRLWEFAAGDHPKGWIRDAKKDKEPNFFGRGLQRSEMRSFSNSGMEGELSKFVLNTCRLPPAILEFHPESWECKSGSLRGGEGVSIRRPGLESQPVTRAQIAGFYAGLGHLISLLQDGRNHAAPEVPAGVLVLLRVVGRNLGPELGPQVLVGADHGAHGHPIQNEALLSPQRTRSNVRHPDHRSLRGRFWQKQGVLGGGSLAHCDMELNIT